MEYLIFWVTNYGVKRCYCVIIYVGHFWPPSFCPIYVLSLIYAPESLLCTSIFLFYYYTLLLTYVVGSPQTDYSLFLMITREGRVTFVTLFFTRVCAQNYSGAQFIAPSRGLITSPSTAPVPVGDWGGRDMRIICE